ncbi:hypothetical protein AMJ39_06995 [candidate division TA06 bacterium DG_24]|jgi:hypothetical protein|uniref:Uncharacterized protein n=2 Tax=Bacteria division TA06 TaxID=1156500 RepID=A0A0S8JHS9_UNCT6|nr:MAG: hypothetical protein AMJ39_06995 [candidate division TA06 bacterium DG_24]KPL09233.1 MAG: hypothetical protein AMJ71_06940 [candidate division TA06 bacterium SM1_40]
MIYPVGKFHSSVPVSGSRTWRVPPYSPTRISSSLSSSRSAAAGAEIVFWIEPAVRNGKLHLSLPSWSRAKTRSAVEATISRSPSSSMSATAGGETML